MSGRNNIWSMIRDVLPLALMLVVGISVILLVTLALPILLPVALVALVFGVAYFWWKSGVGRGRRGPPFDYGP